MNKYIALLRGINVSGKNQIKMVALQTLLESIGFNGVRTYIQSGNIIFSAKEHQKIKFENKIYNAIKDKFGFEVNVIILSLLELENLIKNNPFIKKKKENEKLYVVFLSKIPSSEKVKSLNYSDHLPEDFFIEDKFIYLFVPNGYGRAKLNNNFFENKLKITATTRNWKTVKMLFNLALENNDSLHQ